MAITQISAVGQVPTRPGPTENGTSPAQGERQVVSAGGNTSPPDAQQAPRDGTQVLSPEMTQQALAMIEELMQSQARSLQFEVDEQSGVDIVTVLDGESGEVIRQFPAEEVVASARFIAENMPDAVSGLLLDEQG